MNPEYALVLGLPIQASFLECSLLGTEAHSAGCCGPSSNYSGMCVCVCVMLYGGKVVKHKPLGVC